MAFGGAAWRAYQRYPRSLLSTGNGYHRLALGDKADNYIADLDFGDAAGLGRAFGKRRYLPFWKRERSCHASPPLPIRQSAEKGDQEGDGGGGSLRGVAGA